MSYPYYILKFDGAFRGNPGHSGASAMLFEVQLLEDEDESSDAEDEKSHEYEDCIWGDSEYLGHNKTSNQAEYSALLLGLEYCKRREFNNKLIIKGDSELIIKQLKGEYQVKHKKLIPLHRKAMQLISELRAESLELAWIPREQNTKCDMAANLIIDMELNPEKYEEEEDDESEERAECFGFTREELNILLSYGMKPWVDFNECFDFIEAYHSGENDEEGHPTFMNFLSSSSMWDD